MGKQIDGHIHIERGPYTLEWIKKFVDKAVEMQLDEIWLLEHSFRFDEFIPMYDSARAYSKYVDTWFQKQIKGLKLKRYLEFIQEVREKEFPVKIRFGMEICYFKQHEALIYEQVNDKGFDFLLGSIHFVDDFAFDHTAKLWEGVDVDRIYRKYFDTSVSLAKSRLFDGIGHPDAIKLFGHKPSFPLDEYYENLAESLSESEMYADQNSGVFRRCFDTASLGMDAKLISALKKHNVKIITSSDAHCPEDVGYKIKEMNNLI